MLQPRLAPVFLGALALAGCGDDDTTLIAACARSNACKVQAYSSVSGCVSSYTDLKVGTLGQGPVWDQVYGCVADAGSCDAVRACFGAGPSCDSSFSASCDGGKATFCDLLDKTRFTFDCAGAGLTCKLDPSTGFAASCEGGGQAGALQADGACDGTVCSGSGQSCTPSDEIADRCEGERLQTCIGGEWKEIDCAALGLGPCYTTPGPGGVTLASCAPQ